MVQASLAALIHPLQNTEYSNESDLLAACRRREIRAFEQVYLAHGSRLKSLAFQILGNRQDAEDAVQETFLKLYRGIQGFHGQSSIGTWLCRILINACYDLARKRKREADRATDEQTAGPKNHLPLKVALDDALRRIHPRHRMVFHLFEVEGLRHAEIAAILEVPEGTSKAWLFEAKKELKRMLDGDTAMILECGDLERALRTPELMPDMRAHAEHCAACSEQLYLWSEISRLAQPSRRMGEPVPLVAD